jgi:hypothetical protein
VIPEKIANPEQHSELGSGFQIAMRDLDIRSGQHAWANKVASWQRLALKCIKNT